MTQKMNTVVVTIQAEHGSLLERFLIDAPEGYGKTNKELADNITRVISRIWTPRDRPQVYD